MAQEGRLKVVEGFVRDKLIRLPSDHVFVIGRDHDCDMPVMSRRISRKHAQITFRNGVYAIADLDSKTGTTINERKVTSSVLRHNDLIQVGDLKIRFLMEDAEKPTQADEDTSKPIITPPQPLPAAPAAAPPGAAAQAAKPDSSIDLPRPVFSEEELAAVGRTIGDVRIIAAVNKGRRIVVYKGIQASHNRVVAMKFLREELSQEAEVVNWFVTGAQRAAALRHEDVIVPLGGGRDGERKYVYTHFMDDSALIRFANARRDGLLSAKRALESLVHVARALEFAESKKVYHLGIRPTKILFDENRRAKLNGLGFDNSPSAPGPELPLDAPAYLAPEQLGAADAAPGHATDIFSLGATFYYMLTGRHPERDARQRIASPKLINREAPASLCRIVEKMIEPDPPARYRTYGQMLHDLRWALRGESWPHGPAH